MACISAVLLDKFIARTKLPLGALSSLPMTTLPWIAPPKQLLQRVLPLLPICVGDGRWSFREKHRNSTCFPPGYGFLRAVHL